MTSPITATDRMITTPHPANQLGDRGNKTVALSPMVLSQKEQIKQELRRRIQETLQIGGTLPFNACLEEIRRRLFQIQQYAQFMGKGFVFVEQEITCDQYNLAGSHQDTAVLFRGPNEDASVAICLTHKGSLLYRNGCPWIVYRDAGDTGHTGHSFVHRDG